MNKAKFFILSVVAIIMLSGCSMIDSTSTSITGMSQWYVPFVLTLQSFAALLGNNFGLSIIVVTLFLRLFLAPLVTKQLKNQFVMKELQAEYEDLKIHYSMNAPTDTHLLQDEAKKLYQKYEITPLSGCLPLFIQILFLYGFFMAIQAMDSLNHATFLWFYLGKADVVVSIVAGCTTYMYQYFWQQVSPNEKKQMEWMFPILVTVLSMLLPSAVSLYWIFNNIFLIIQSILLKQSMSFTLTAEKQK